MSAIVCLKQFNKYGKGLVAATDIAPGTRVICEDPLIAFPRQVSPELWKFISDNRVTSVFKGENFAPEFANVLHAFATSDGQTQQKTLQLYHAEDRCTAPIISAVKSFVTQIECLKENGLLAQSPLQAAQHISADDISKALLIWAMNSHVIHGQQAYLELISRVIHTCGQPNTRPQTDPTQPGKCIYVATCAIRSNELLTTNYLGFDEKCILSTPFRQAHLRSTKLFTCECGSCSQQFDTCRGLYCPACNPDVPDFLLMIQTDELLTTAWAQAFKSSGCVLHDNSKPAESKPWSCTKCKATFSTLQVVGQVDSRADRAGMAFKLDPESDLEQRVFDLAVSFDDLASVQVQELVNMMHSALAVLGPRHWTTFRIMVMLLDTFDELLRRDATSSSGGIVSDTLAYHARVVCRLLQSCWQWLEAAQYNPALILLHRSARVLSTLAAATAAGTCVNSAVNGKVWVGARVLGQQLGEKVRGLIVDQPWLDDGELMATLETSLIKLAAATSATSCP